MTSAKEKSSTRCCTNYEASFPIFLALLPGLLDSASGSLAIGDSLPVLDLLCRSGDRQEFSHSM